MLTFAQTFPDTEAHPEGCAMAGCRWSVKRKSLSQSKSSRDLHQWAVLKAGEDWRASKWTAGCGQQGEWGAGKLNWASDAGLGTGSRTGQQKPDWAPDGELRFAFHA